jgi:hypothetical protein
MLVRTAPFFGARQGAGPSRALPPQCAVAEPAQIPGPPGRGTAMPLRCSSRQRHAACVADRPRALSSDARRSFVPSRPHGAMSGIQSRPRSCARCAAATQLRRLGDARSAPLKTPRSSGQGTLGGRLPETMHNFVPHSSQPFRRQRSVSRTHAQPYVPASTAFSRAGTKPSLRRDRSWLFPIAAPAACRRRSARSPTARVSVSQHLTGSCLPR